MKPAKCSRRRCRRQLSHIQASLVDASGDAEVVLQLPARNAGPDLQRQEGEGQAGQAVDAQAAALPGQGGFLSQQRPNKYKNISQACTTGAKDDSHMMHQAGRTIRRSAAGPVANPQ